MATAADERELPAGDKRSVMPIEQAEVDPWLFGTVEQAVALVKLAPQEAFNAAPAS